MFRDVIFPLDFLILNRIYKDLNADNIAAYCGKAYIGGTSTNRITDKLNKSTTKQIS